MKKIYSIVLAAFAIVAAASCNKEVAPAENIQEEIQNNGKVEMVFDVSVDDVKSTLTDDLKVYFVDGDEIAVYDGIAADPNKFIVESASGNNAVIRGTVSEGAQNFQAVYPFSQAIGVRDGVLTINVPSTQEISAGKNFDPRALVSIASAAAGSTLKFKNAVSLLKFAISGSDVKSVSIMANNGEVLTGDLALSDADNTVTGVAEVTVVSETALPAGTYYATVLPTNIAGGFGVMCQKAGGFDYKVSDKAASIVANSGLNLSTVDGTAFPTELKTKQEFIAFVNFASLLDASYQAKLGADIDMQGAKVNSIKSFVASFDGQGHALKNLKITKPLFTENKGTVKGLIIGEDCTVDAASAGQEFAPIAKDNYGTIENCTNKAALTFTFNAPVTGSTVYSGICVYNNAGGTVKGCKNEGAIKYDVTGTSEAWGVAGICAFSAGTVEGCTNSAAISCAAERCSAKTKIRNISATGCLGGIVCYAATGMVVSNCTNSGNLDYNVYKIEDASGNINRNQVGGIVAAPAGEVKACTNTGSITAKAVTSTGTALSSPEYIVGIGGISGGDYFAAGTNESDITDCVNEGAINVTFDAKGSNSTVGGIVAWPGVEGDAQTNKITNCTNKGNITISGGGKGRFGGVAGGSGNLFKCKNYGTVTNNTNVSGSCVGGVSGYRNNTLMKIEECESYGDVVNTHGDLVYTGGLIGAWGGKDFNSGIGCIVKCNLDVTADDLEKANKYTGLVIGRFNGDNNDVLGSAEKPIKVQTGSSVTINGTKTVADGSNFTTLCTGKERTVSFNGADPGCKRQVYVSFE